MTKSTVRRLVTRESHPRASERSVPFPAGRKDRMSLTRRSTCLRPLRGGMTFSTRSLKSSSPTRSLLAMAENAICAATSAAISDLRVPRDPNSSDAETSTRSTTVSSRSSVKTFTCGELVRAVTFQSMERMSSPAWYGRTSLKAIPRPLKTEWYCPARSAETTWRVAISRRRIRRMSSRGSIGLPTVSSGVFGALGDLDLVEHPLHHLLRRELLGLGLVGERHPVPEHVHPHRLHVLRGDEASVAEERVGPGGERQEQRRSGARAEVDGVLEVGQPEALGLAGRPDDVQDVVLHLVVHVDLMNDLPGAGD